MRPALRVHALRQRGIVTRKQARLAGYGATELRDKLRDGGPWLAVRRGVYVERVLWDDSADLEREIMRDLAADMMMRREHLMSHDSAARALGIPMLQPKRSLVHVTREGVRGGRTEHGVSHHMTRCELGSHLVAGGMRVTNPARTALDLAREHGRDMGVVAIDHVRGRGTTLAELHRELEVMSSWPYKRTATLALELSDARAESIAESLGRLLLGDCGFDHIDVGWPIRVRGRHYWTDLRVGCHIVEVDGLGKLIPVSEGGLATRSTRETLRAQRDRQNDICGEGLGMSRLGFEDFFGVRRERAMERVLKEEAITRARYGPDLPAYLAEQARQIRRDHPRRQGSSWPAPA